MPDPSPFTTIAASAELPRDRWGRPLITPPEGGEPIAYTRVTTFVKAVDDTYFLQQWAKRQVALGMAARRDLVLAVLAVKDPDNPNDKKTLNRLAEQAMEAAKAHARAETGTALHSFTETIDAGGELGYIPEEYVGDLEAYRSVVRYLGKPVAMEGFCVVDRLRVGGSYDRIWEFTEDSLALFAEEQGRPMTYPNGELVRAGDAIIGDLKTGRSIDFGIGAIAMQLATYANAVDYDHTLGARTPIRANRKDWGIVVHVAAGTGRAHLVWVDLTSGWEVVEDVLPRVHAWRKRKDLSTPLASVVASTAPGPSIVEQIATATSYEALKAIYAANADKWTPGLTTLAAKRTAELKGS